ncbi:unnamed protein product [Fraxinus pennsylvanica]|uniref:FAR1 domain-containing protein n=1 Tax=Fraxinus pennsylvanica TaxID=56036 RepID=A0AAD2EBC3_9LAMI|nr:unnamed protein product [Fraxinus pennsylvanica]
MDVEVVEVERQKRQKNGETQDECSKDENQSFPENSIEEVSNQVDDGNGSPYVGMEFQSEEAAKNFYDAYARRVGFSTHVGQYSRTMPDGPIISWDFACSREIFKRKNVESCNAVLRIEKQDPDSWVVTKFGEHHNHSIVSPSKVHYLRPRRHFVGATKNVSETVYNQNDVMISIDGNHGFDDPNHVFKNTSQLEKTRDARHGSGNLHENGRKKASMATPDMIPSLWPWQDTLPTRFNLNDVRVPVADLNQPTMVPIAIKPDGGLADNTAVLTCFKSMTWAIENNTAASKVAVINLKLQDYGKTPSGETEVQFRLTRITLEPMLKSMAYKSQQLSMSANRVAVINLKLQDSKTTTALNILELMSLVSELIKQELAQVSMAGQIC